APPLEADVVEGGGEAIHRSCLGLGLGLLARVRVPPYDLALAAMSGRVVSGPAERLSPVGGEQFDVIVATLEPEGMHDERVSQATLVPCARQTAEPGLFADGLIQRLHLLSKAHE